MKYISIPIALVLAACSPTSVSPMLTSDMTTSDTTSGEITPIATTPEETTPVATIPSEPTPVTMTPSEPTSGAASPAVDPAPVDVSPAEPPANIIYIGEIRWSDGDSGRLAEMPFRLKDIDAPETGNVGSAIGGAKCALEQELGLQAKAFIIALTENAAIQITNNYGPDRYEAGVLRPWPHDENGKSLTSKPNWCE